MKAQPSMIRWKLLARHKDYVKGATISESINENSTNKIPCRRFTATIRGFQNWRLYQGDRWKMDVIIKRVYDIRDRIDRNDESVFSEKGAW